MIGGNGRSPDFQPEAAPDGEQGYREYRGRAAAEHYQAERLKYASGETDRNGAISKCGDALLRTTLYQATLALLTRTKRWWTLKAWGVAVAKRRGLRRAIVAVARKLAVVLHRIWADGSEFRWSREKEEVA